MANPSLLQDDFSRGMKRDYPRNRMPNGSVWNAVDWIPNDVGSLRGRGGWQNASNDIAAVTATASYVIGGIYANYEDGAENLAIDEDGRLYSIASNGTVTDEGAVVTVSQNPVIHRDKVVIPAAGGGTAPKVVTNASGTLTIANLGGSPPNGVYATVFEDRTLLANSSANPNRLWFSDAGDPEGWDTTNTWWDFSFPITGLAALSRTILVFHDGYMSRLIGSTPPPGSDFDAADPLFTVGTTDARSIAVFGDRVLFANPEGIFITDGSGQPANYVQLCSMRKYWRELMSGYTKSTWTLVAGVLERQYHLCVMDGTTFKDHIVIDLDRVAFWRHSNIDARAMWSAEAATDELYFGRRGAARVGKLSTMFLPQSTYKNDGDGDAVAPVLETGYFEGELGEKAWRQLYVGYDLTDHATDNPTLTISYIPTPEDTSYTALSGTLAETTKREFGRKQLGFAADGIAVKVAKANAGDVKLFSLEADVHAREQSRRAA